MVHKFLYLIRYQIAGLRVTNFASYAICANTYTNKAQQGASGHGYYSYNVEYMKVMIFRGKKECIQV